jgi:hypothetical protein
MITAFPPDFTLSVRTIVGTRLDSHQTLRRPNLSCRRPNPSRGLPLQMRTTRKRRLANLRLATALFKHTRATLNDILT